MKKLSLLLVISLISSALFAGIKPLEIRYEEGESFPLTLSKFNFSRIFVEGEKILRVRVPQGTFVIENEESSPEEEGISSGSVYLKPKFDAELTAYFTTDKGHHFSLRVTPDEGAGKTVRMRSKHQYSVHSKKQNKHVQQLEQLMSAMIQGSTPFGFDGMKVADKPFFVKKYLKLRLEKLYRGKGFTGYVYRIENTGKRAIDVNSSLFAAKGVKAMVLSKTHLNPHQSTHLYSLLNDRERGGSYAG